MTPWVTVGQAANTLAVELFGPLVKRDSLGSAVDHTEATDAELLSGLHDCGRPTTAFLQKLRSPLVLLLGNHLASGIDHQVRLDEARLGVGRSTVPNLAVRSGEHGFRHTLRLLGLGSSNGSLGLRRHWFLGSARLDGGACFD